MTQPGDKPGCFVFHSRVDIPAGENNFKAGNRNVRVRQNRRRRRIDVAQQLTDIRALRNLPNCRPKRDETRNGTHCYSRPIPRNVRGRARQNASYIPGSAAENE